MTRSKKSIFERLPGKTLLARTIIFILVTLLIVFVVLTLLIAVFTALKPPEETVASAFSFLPKNWKFSNFSEAMSGDTWGRFYFNSAFVTIVVVILSILLSSLAGFSFARLRFRGRQPLFVLFLCGLMVPSQAYIIPQYILLRSIPLVGGNDISGMGGTGLLNTYWSLIIPYTVAPLGIFLCRQFYLSFPKSLDEAAIIDGCGAMGVYCYIYLPLSKPVFATFAILKFTGTWNDFFYPLIMTSTKSMHTVQIALQLFRGEYGVQWHYLMAATVVSILPILVVFLCAQKYFIQGIVTTGLK